jgi:hypothetical protein
MNLFSIENTSQHVRGMEEASTYSEKRDVDENDEIPVLQVIVCISNEL